MESNNSYKYGVKSVYAQILALAGTSFIQMGIGIEVMCSTVIIGALAENKNHDEKITLTSEQAAWFGSLLFLFTPLGSLLSSVTLGRFGHNKCMVITNVPYIASQLMFLFAEDVKTLYACSILMGISIGYSGGPCSSYIGEVCEPKLRGTLMSATNMCYFAGSLLFTSLYAITTEWRLTVLISISVPVINVIIVLMSPHSPMWLLIKGKPEKAQKTLGKLRGWVSHEKCSSEFREMAAYTSLHGSNNSSNDKNKEDITSSWGQLLQPEVYRPFRLLMAYLFFANLLAGIQYGPFLVSVFTEFGAPVDVPMTIAFSTFLSMAGNILTIFLVNKLGKRFLTLSTLSVCSICYILIGLIGIYWTNSKPLTSWIVLILYLTTTLTSSFGIMPVAWILISEIFPLKSRNITCSICTALGYLMSFFMIKFYPELSTLVTFYNTFTVFGVSGLFGCVYFYFYLPETENKTLQEISEFFK